MFCLNLMRIALELAKENQRLRGPGHQVLPALHLRRRGHEEDGRPRLPALGRGGRLLLRRAALSRTAAFEKFRVRSLVGLIPLYAVERLEEQLDRAVHGVPAQPALVPARTSSTSCRTSATRSSATGRRIHVLRDRRRGADRSGMLRADPRTRTSSSRPGGCAASPSTTTPTPSASATSEVRYEPAEADSKIKGGNSNWRGPVWFPTSFLMIESLRKLGTAFGPDVHGAGRRRDGPPRDAVRGGGGPGEPA